MGRLRLPVFAAISATAALALGGAAIPATSALPGLYVTYIGDTCTFTMTNDSGSKVTSIAPGTYQIVFYLTDDDACDGLPDFQLTGPGLNLETPVDLGTGASAQFNVTFSAGSTYIAQDNHKPAASRITFTTQSSGSAASVVVPVGGIGPATATKSTDLVGSQAAKAVLRGSLDAIVYKSGKLSLTHNGKVVSSLKQGSWTFSVDDESSKAGFSVQVLNGKAQTITSAAYVGSQGVTVSLKPGRWFFFSSSGKKSTFFVTT